jgi:AcrR family transcriptional regulator
MTVHPASNRSSPRPSKRRRRPDPEQEARWALRKQELLEAADRVVRRDGPATSMNDIAREAGITKPILYKHFGDKGGLYQALAERYVRSLLDELRVALAAEREPQARIRRTIDSYLLFVERESEIYNFLMHRAVTERPEARATVADFIRQLAAELSIVLGDELRRAGLDSGGAEPWAHGIVGMVQLAGDRWLEQRSMSRENLVDYLEALIWKGLSDAPAEVARAGSSQASENR